MAYGDDAFVDHVRYLNKDINESERDLVEGYWTEQIQHYGVSVEYYQSNFSINDHDKLYGEDPSRAYSEPKTIILAPTLQESAVLLQNIGLMSDDEVNAYIPIKVFHEYFGENAEPKPGDVFDFEEFGRTRFNGRTGRKFEITERLDEEIQQINQLMGHYVWLIKAKRFDYSYEPGIDPEGASENITDDTFEGILPGSENPASPAKTVPGSADEEGKSIFDYTQYGDNDDVYGDYGS